MPTFDLIAIGDTMNDIFLEMAPENAHLYAAHKKDACQICFTYADKIPVKAKHDLIGGNSANAAIAFARLGFKAAMYTHVGDDMAGSRIQADFKENGVADDYVVVDRGKESNYSTVINLNAERTILIYHLHRDYALPKLDKAGWVYLSSMGQGFEKILPDLCDYLDATGAKLCYQPGTFQLNYGARRSREILKRTEVFAVNKEEAELYLGRPAGSTFRELLEELLALGPRTVMISDGQKGAYASDGEQFLYLGIIKEAPRVEVTGAGDAFTSGFLAALASGEPLGEALRWGQAESSSVIQLVGPQAGLLRKKQLHELLEKHPTLRAVPLEQHEK